MEQGMSCSQIRDHFQKLYGEVCLQTVCEWRNWGEWKKLRKEYFISKHGLKRRMLNVLNKVLEHIEKKPAGDINSRDADSLNKSLKNYLELEEEQITRGTVLEFLKLVIGYLKEKAPEVLEQLQPHILPLGKVLMEAYATKKKRK